MKHNPEALVLSMAKGLDNCRADDSAKYLAFILRNLASAVVGSELNDEADAIDAAIFGAAVVPVLRKLSDEQREKVLTDLECFAGLFAALAAGLREELQR